MKKKGLWIGIGAVGVIVIALILILTIPNKPKQAATPVQNTTRVSKGDITVSVTGSGSTVSTESDSVRTKDEGKVSEVHVKAGDVVKKGQVLLTFEGTDNSDNLKAQQSSLESQQLDLVDLQEQFKRQVQEGADEQTLNTTKKSITKQELNISNTEAEIAKLKEDMVPPDPLTSPIDGTVTAVNITAGEQAKSGSELFVINDYQKLSVKIQVDELDIPNVEEGMKATVQVDALPDQTFEGTVSDIADEGTASGGVSLFDVTIALNDSEGVRVGMSAEATIITEEKQDVLTLPIEAVQQRGGRYVVLLSEGESGESSVPVGGQPPDAEATPPQAGSGARSNDASEAPANRQGRGTGASGVAGGNGGSGSMGGRMQVVEVGAHNETLIEIVSGLTEGQEVVIPTVISNSSGSATQQQTRMQGGFGGSSGLSGGSAGFSGGAAPGGGGAAPTGGGGGFGGGGGR
ncbi:efflux RND transporter periplasmic adaptor subunit [Paenibacillus sp. MBLB2552]|uniref:Efflux RND transporter periplasmic adaptor subunit n=1 Tax=Paenibacillus mellifer TaxID=2937794 RepID=A0A9X1XTR3_9BACL|nr:efflux RND transporter periplasmic adaptor subunit [Paenibacillus mellifer]MCK8485830.1 efflux RND transporter periplasmic adaptor subunit [Paenibacillus mellifer]